MLEARELACLRGERVVFAGLSFALEAGAALLLTGANGAGKSSLLRLLAGLIPPAEGMLLWQGQDALADRATHARRLRYLSHQDALKPALTARENLAFFARLWGGDAEARARIGYAPEDDAEAYAAELEGVPTPGGEVAARFHGGSVCALGFQGDPERLA